MRNIPRRDKQPLITLLRFFGSSCASNGKDAHTTPETHLCIQRIHRPAQARLYTGRFLGQRLADHPPVLGQGGFLFRGKPHLAEAVEGVGVGLELLQQRRDDVGGDLCARRAEEGVKGAAGRHPHLLLRVAQRRAHLQQQRPPLLDGWIVV
eukprot:1195439-Prorocentrum_minimum.AAC.1